MGAQGVDEGAHFREPQSVQIHLGAELRQSSTEMFVLLQDGAERSRVRALKQRHQVALLRFHVREEASVELRPHGGHVFSVAVLADGEDPLEQLLDLPVVRKKPLSYPLVSCRVVAHDSRAKQAPYRARRSRDHAPGFREAPALRSRARFARDAEHADRAAQRAAGACDRCMKRLSVATTATSSAGSTGFARCIEYPAFSMRRRSSGRA